MSTDNTDDEQQLEPDEPMTTRRETIAAGAALGLPMFLGFGSDDDLGYFDTHWIANSGQKLAKDPPLLNFGSGIKAVETDDGVDIIIPDLDETTSSGGSGAFEDTDGDGVAELQDDHADFLDGEARGLSGLSGNIAPSPITNLVGSNLSVDADGNLNASSGGSGSSIFSDSDGDGIYEQTTGDAITGTAFEQFRFGFGNTGYSGRLSDRPMVTESETILTVGTDTATIQEALNQIPLIIRHNFEIQVPDGDYSGEDLLVPPFMVADDAGMNRDDVTGEGASHLPRITGNIDTPTNVQVGSFTVTGTQGAIAPLIEGFNVVGYAPPLG